MGKRFQQEGPNRGGVGTPDICLARECSTRHLASGGLPEGKRPSRLPHIERKQTETTRSTSGDPRPSDRPLLSRHPLARAVVSFAIFLTPPDGGTEGIPRRDAGTPSPPEGWHSVRQPPAFTRSSTTVSLLLPQSTRCGGESGGYVTQ